MSRPRSRSPHYRRFPWEESNFDPYKVVAELDEDQLERRHGPREYPEEHVGYFRGVMYPEGQRRSPNFSDDRTFWHQRHPKQEEFYHRRSSPHHDGIFYEDRRISSLRDGGGDGDRRRGGFHSQSFENRGRFRELSPSGRSDDQRGRRRNTQGPNRDRQREDSHRERNPPFKRHRRQMDDGFRTEEDFMDQRYLVDSPRDSFGGDTQESPHHGDIRQSVPLVIEHDHGIKRGRKRFDDRRDLDLDFDRQRSPRPMSSSQERLRTFDRRLDDREGTRGHHLQDNWRDYHESRSSPTSQDRTNSMIYGSQDGPMNHRERGGPLSARELFGQGHGGRIGPHRNQPRLPQSSQGYRGPHEEQRQEYRHFRGENPNEGQPGGAQETRPQWKHDRPRSLERHLFKTEVDPTMPRERVRGWTDQKNTTVEMEETLTIKVDTSQPINQNSSLCYSLDRQLSLDLVNVGRQRLDFLPMLEHSGTYRETAMHTGTFAQEIITLVHHVKEQYFRNAGITLNERFSAPPTGDHSETETEELTLDQRFSSNRGFSLKMSSLLDDDEPLFSRLGPLQPVRGPGDLRHDLERKRQERLEGVKVTISGNSTLQRPLAPLSESVPEHSQNDQLGLMEDEGSSSWRREGSMGPRRGTSYRPTGSQRRNNRFINRLGPMRRQNPHNNPTGPRW